MSKWSVPGGPVRKHVGQKLRAARLERRWSLARAEAETGVTKVTLGSWERGDRVPSLDGLWAVVQAYGMRIEEFFPEQADVPPEPRSQDLYRALEQFRALVDAAVGDLPEDLPADLAAADMPAAAP